MSTGLFSVRDDRRGGPRRGYVPKNRRLPPGAKASFAEAMANGAETIRAASRIVGVPEATGSHLWRRIKADLGWQAQ